MMDASWVKTVCVCGTVVVCAVVMSNAGPLDPPGGPVTSTMRTLDEVSGRIPINQTNTPGNAGALFRITSSGSYYLTRDWTVGQDQTGIEIAAQDVTIDLNGRALIGEGLFTTQSGDGSNRASGSLAGSVTIRNGIIRGFDGAGVDFTDRADQLLIEGVTAIGCTGGFLVTDYSVVRRCIARDCQNFGFAAPFFGGGADGGTIEDNIAINCDVGFLFANTNSGHVIVRNRAYDCATDGYVFGAGNAVGPIVNVLDPFPPFDPNQFDGLTNFILLRPGTARADESR